MLSCSVASILERLVDCSYTFRYCVNCLDYALSGGICWYNYVEEIICEEVIVVCCGIYTHEQSRTSVNIGGSRDGVRKKYIKNTNLIFFTSALTR
jgi:hypothetical protein